MELAKKFKGIFPSEVNVSGIKIQDIITRLLIVFYIWFSFYLSYIDTYSENPTFADILLHIIRFFTRPFEFVIDKIFYS